MPILDFRAYRLERYIEGSVSYNADGDAVTKEGEWKYVCRCNAVPAGQMRQIPLPDGQLETYSYTLNLPVDVEEFKYGERIRLSFQDYPAQVLTVKGFHRYQHQCKLWA